MRRVALSALLLALALASAVQAQDRVLYNQDALADLLYAREDSLELIPEATYRYYVLQHPSGNSIWARHDLYRMVGDGDIAAGRDRLSMAEFFNRVRIGNLSVGDTLILPDPLDADHRAYSPFPRHYEGAASFDKLFIIHKGFQAWAAYEHGRLRRWGLVNTGKESTPTPAGRFNFNWKEEDRVSDLSPPGETWRMRYVFNFNNDRGIHVHQYSMPTGEPASHGCVRLILADAMWIYDWADPWRTTVGSGALGYRTARGRVLEQGTPVLVLGDGEEPRDGPAELFERTADGPRLRTVTLPEDPYSVPPGTDQQRTFDRRRT